MRNEDEQNKVISFYTHELNNYKSIATPNLHKLIEEEISPYKYALDVLYDIYMFQNYLIEPQQQIFDSNTNRTLGLFMIKVGGDIFSLRQCLSIGQLISASSIERNILETYVDVRIITEKNTEERSKLYEEFQHAMLWSHLQEVKEYIDELEMDTILSDERRNQEKKIHQDFYTKMNNNEIQENYEKVKGNYHPKYPHHWAWSIFKDEIKDKRNPSIKFLCKKLYAYTDYLNVYVGNSASVHNRPFMANFMKRNDGITSTPIFSETTAFIAGISASLVIEIINMIIAYVKPEKAKEIEMFLGYLFKELSISEKL